MMSASHDAVTLFSAASGAFSILLDATLKGAGILVFAGLLTFLMRRASAAARHLTWFLAAVSLLVLPQPQQLVVRQMGLYL